MVRRRVGSCLVALVALVLLTFALTGLPRASSLEVEINGRDYYGTLFVEGGEIYAPLDVVGSLILGRDFDVDGYDVVLRRVTYRFTPPGKSPVRQGVSPCIKRGVALFVPLRPLVLQAGGTYTVTGSTVRIAYPPVALVTMTPTPVERPSPVAVPSTVPVVTPTAVPTVAIHMLPAPLAPDAALAAARATNHGMLRSGGLIRRIELFHPVSPDAADAIPRTDLAGLKVTLKKLAPRDHVWIEMWNGSVPEGPPAFERHVQGFRGQELQENWFFVRLPLPVEAGWHTVRVDLNHRESVIYRFITY